MTAAAAGLCESCRHQQIVPTTRGSLFSLCRRAQIEPDRFVRYPRLPVLQCSGHESSEDYPVVSSEAG